LAAVVQSRTEDERAVALIDCPAGEDARQLGDILLRVSAIDAQGVELHDLAGVVFVERTATRAGVVEIEKHRRRLRGRGKQILEASPDARADRIALVAGDHETIGTLADED